MSAAATRTERLLLRRPGSDDLDGYLRLFLRPEVGEWLRPSPLDPFDEEEIRGLLSADLRHWEEHGFGLWAAIDPASGELVGRVGVRWAEIEGERVGELVWTILPDRHGEGLAAEAAVAAVGAAREHQVDGLVAMILPGNLPSRRVAEKLGMEVADEVVYFDLPHLRYRSALT
ncbi:MAG: GNAT family N-acetyltransferase [Solirubrobacterales bacterium]